MAMEAEISKTLGANQSEMIDVFYKQIRCVLELAVAVWTPAMTKAECYQIERVQKCALHIIMGDRYLNYEHAVSHLDVEKLSNRRPKMCLSFALRLEKHEKYSNWFHPAEEFIPLTMNTRSDKTVHQSKYKPVPFRTDQFTKSPIPFLTEILNEHYARKK